MEPEEMIVTFEDFESETILQTKESKPLIHKSVACQTACYNSSQSSLPMIFCALFSPANEASTQVDIPRKVSVGVSACMAETIPSPTPKVKLVEKNCEKHFVKEKKKHVEEILENMISGTGKGQVADSCHQEDIDTDQLLDEASLILSPNDENVKEPEDSEFSSDDDCGFWAKMRKLSKTKKRKSKKSKRGYKFIKYQAEFSKHNLKLPKDFYTGHSTVDSQLPSKLSDKSEKPVESSVNIKEEPDSIDDDWITDNEVDERIDIDLAFKLEWKKKRHPYNTKEKNFVCEVCGKLYSKHHYLREHIVRDHGDHEQAKLYPYSCQFCRRLYSGERQLAHHRQQQSGPCEICGLMLKCSGLFWVHRRNHDAECNICGKTFHSRNSLDMHTKIKHGERTVPCPLCPRMFPFKFLMNKHISKAHHPGVKTQHTCDTCDFWAKTEGALRIHQRRVHNIEPPLYPCGVCNAKFSTKHSYKLHMAQHLGENGFTCQMCAQTFDFASELRSHKKTMHSRMTRSGARRKVGEQQQQHVNQYFPCSVCSTVLTTQGKLSQHMLHSHIMDNDHTSMKEEVVESIQLAEMNENGVSVIQINVNDEDIELQGDTREFTEQSNLDLGSGINYSGTRSALLMPASVVPPDVSMVDIDGVQYHVIRGSQ